MKAITLFQPWASFIAWGWKTIETRTHIKFRHLIAQYIGIHAGKRWDVNWWLLASEYLTLEQIRITKDLEFRFMQDKESDVRSAIICDVWVSDFDKLNKEHSESALIDCESITRFGLFLKDVKLIQPIKIKGHQGAWNYNGEVIYL